MRIEIFEEDGESSLVFEDEYAEYTIDVDPGSKTYQSRTSRKDDVYYRTQKFEYRICTTPVRVEVRLLERLERSWAGVCWWGGGLGWARCCWALVEMRDFLCERNDKNKEQKYYYSDRK